MQLAETTAAITTAAAATTTPPPAAAASASPVATSTGTSSTNTGGTGDASARAAFVASTQDSQVFGKHEVLTPECTTKHTIRKSPGLK